VLDLPALRARAEDLAAAYESASPFPHIVLDDLLPAAVVAQAIAEFPALDAEQWNSYVHANERKFADTDAVSWGPTLRAVLAELNSPQFVDLLEQLTGIDDLVPDEMLEGGGLHQSIAGGFLNIHADFTAHPRRRDWHRRVNLLLYLNETWDPGWGGELELWSSDMQRCERRITPIANRVVIFTTDLESFHGHPDPMRCPPGVARKSLALYYFTVESDLVVRATHYRSRPGEGLRSAVIALDNLALRMYGFARRRLGMSDRTAGRLLGRLDRARHRSDPSEPRSTHRQR
jgi:hypothetical protein